MPNFGSYQPPSSGDGRLPPRDSYRDDDEPARLKAAVRATDVIEAATERRFRHNGDHADTTCPWCQEANDREPKFRVWSDGGYNCAKDPDHKGGDVLDFLQALRGYGFPEALAELRRFVGGEAPPIDRAKLAAEIARSRAKEAAERARKQAYARELWARATPDLPQEAVAYLRDERKLPNHAALPLRFLADCPHGEEGERADSVLAPVTDAAGNVVGIHRIAVELPADGKRRKMLGAVQGHAVRLAPAEGDTLALAEGVETAAAVAALTGHPTWATLSAGNLPGQAIPAHVRRLIVVADHDEPSKPHPGPGGTGHALARKAAATYAAPGRRVEIWTTPEPDSDANDALRGLCGPLRPLEAVGPREAAGHVEASPEPRLEKTPGPAGPIALAPFAVETTDHAVALAAAEREVAERMAAAVGRVELHALCRAAGREAREEAREAFCRELGKELDELTRAERVRCGRAAGKARREAEDAFLAGRGLDSLPEPDSRLFTGSTGVGKSAAAARALATMKAGVVEVAAPTLAKCDEFGADLEAFARSSRPTNRPDPGACVWCGGPCPKADLVNTVRREDGRHEHLGCGLEARAIGAAVPPAVETFDPLTVIVKRGRTALRPGEPEGGLRMCQRDEDVVKEVQGTGASVLRAMCSGCPLKEECESNGYLAQQRKIKARKGGALVVVFPHEGLFLPARVTADMVIVDEDAALKAARATIVPPEQVVAPSLWAGAEPFVADFLGAGPKIALAAIAGDVAASLAETGRELAELRARGITPGMLDSCAEHLFHRHRELTRAIENAGADDAGLRRLVRELHAHAYRPIGTLFVRLAEEMAHERPATNGTRRELLPVEESEADGSKKTVLRPRFVVRSLRTPRIRKGAELVVLDATGDARLVGAAFRPVEESRGHVPLLGKVWQTSTRTNSKARLLKAAGHADKLAALARQVERTATLAGGEGLFVCAPLKILDVLKPLVAAGNVTWLNYGRERGLNTAEGCRVGMVIGREEVSPGKLESTARCFAAADPAPFVSIMPPDAGEDAADGEDGRTWLVPATRARLMRDGSTEVAATTVHPDPWAAAILFQIREAGVVQAAGRLRMSRRPGKLLILATSVPVPIEVDRLVNPVELERATDLAAGMIDSLAEHGVALVDPKALGVQPVRLAPVVELAAGLLGSVGNPCKGVERGILRFCTGFAAHEARVRSGARGPRAVAWVVSSQPPVEAFAAAKAAGWNVESVLPLAVPPMAPEHPAGPDFMDPRVWELPTGEDRDDAGGGEYADTPTFALPYYFRPAWMPAAELIEAGYTPVARGGILRDMYHWPTFGAVAGTG